MQEHQHEHSHGSHHAGMVHEPAAETLLDYERALAAARPLPGGSVIRIELEAGEIDWEFIPGTRTRAWGYNGQTPGPVIEARVGDVLEVRLTNGLPEATMIHWHGMRLPPSMDGTENVQHPVAPGASYVYRYLLQDAGTYWYHPHINETKQLEQGLYGALIVRGDSEPDVDGERVFILDDIALAEDGSIAPGGSWLEQHDGRQGQTLLVNGRARAELAMHAGQVERWRIINASSARYVRLSLGGATFLILGTDGGLIERPVAAQEALLAPGDRFDIAVGPFVEADTIRVEALPYDRGAVQQTGHEVLARVRVGAPAPSHAHIPASLRRITPLATAASTPTRTVTLAYRHSDEAPAFTINQELHHRAEPVKLGELQVWDVVNESALDHPFHLHGYFFQVLRVNGAAPPCLSWEDTVNIPAHGTVRIAWLPDERPGEWMYHCHILEHHAGGMMAHFQVVP